MICILSIISIVFEIYVAIIYGVIGFANIDIINFTLLRMIPTIILNVILLIILFPAFIKFMKNSYTRLTPVFSNGKMQ